MYNLENIFQEMIPQIPANPPLCLDADTLIFAWLISVLIVPSCFTKQRRPLCNSASEMTYIVSSGA